MRSIPQIFNRNGYVYTQIKREGKVAVYRQKNLKKDYEFYEVVVIREAKAWKLKGKAYIASEKYPATSQWGRFGFTFQKLANAEKKFRELLVKYAPQYALQMAA